MTLLHKWLAVPALAAGCIVLSPGSVAVAGEQDFTLVNQTGVEIHRLYTAPHSSDDWEEDVLGDDTLADGESLEIQFPKKEKASKWDLRIEDSDGNSIEWEDLKLKEISTVTLHYKNGKAWADIE